MRKLYSIVAAAKYLGMSTRNFKYHQARGNIMPYCKLGRSPMFLEDDLDEFSLRSGSDMACDDARYYTSADARYYTSADAARAMGISRALFSHHYTNGHISHSLQVDDRTPLFSVAELQEFVQEYHPKGLAEFPQNA